MAIFISSIVKGQTEAGYTGVLKAVEDAIRKAPGFIFHCAYPAGDAWQITEIWESKAAADQWFSKNIVPNLPPGVHPKRSYHVLHSVVMP